MNECIDTGVKEMLPDLLHGNLGDADRARVELHLAACDPCRQELEVLRMVKSAAVFEPAIDVVRIARQIPPYGGVPTRVEAPTRSRMVSWLVAASVAIVVVGGGSVLLSRQNAEPVQNATAVVRAPEQQAPPVVSSPNTVSPDLGPATSGHTPSGQPHMYALAAGVDSLSDSDLRQLMTDMDQFDALPAAEPDPVIAVDSGDDLSQDLR